MKTIRIANAGGYWGDDPYALRRQVQGELPLDYISIDFLAEITMSILQKQRAQDQGAGFARDFLTQLEPVLEDVLSRRIKIVTNAGGVNPAACAEALLELGRQKGLRLKVAVIEGDDVLARIPALLSAGVDLKNLDTGEKLAGAASRVVAANAYFGSRPVVEALKHDPDVVLSGRVTDTGITLGAMIHAFSWSFDDWNALASGIIAGHIIECGAQATGGNFTDWQKVASFVDLGFPIVECTEDGSFVVTKHPGTGGLVTCQTVREQLLYEMGDPQSYLTPDVVADFSTVELEQVGADRVRVSGARGRKPTDLLKVSIADEDGFKSAGTLIVSGPDARAKAEVFASVLWTRLAQELERAGLSPIESVHTEYIGSDSTHHRLSPRREPTEILLRVAARDRDREKLGVFRKLLPSLILSGPAGVAVTGGAPPLANVVSYWPALMPQEHAPYSVKVLETRAGERASVLFHARDLAWPRTGGTGEPDGEVADPYPGTLVAGWDEADTVGVPLMQIAHARSGDKGDTANIGLIGRSPECYVWLRENVTAERVKDWFQDVARGAVRRYLVPRLWALNFLLEESLGGGGTVSLYIDAQGKTLSQALLRCEVTVPAPLLETIAPENAPCPGELVPAKREDE